MDGLRRERSDNSTSPNPPAITRKLGCPKAAFFRRMAGVGTTVTPLFESHSMRTIGHFINGKTVAGPSGRFGDIYNPSTNEEQTKVARAGGAGGRAAGGAAGAAGPAGAAGGPRRRARV